MANLSKALNTDMAGLAQILRKKGRGRDTVLAHITPQEAALLKARGGRGSTNPDTGLPEFELDDDLAIGGASPATEAGPASSEGITGQGLVDTGGKPSGLGDYSLSSGVPTVGLGQTGVPGGTGQGLADTNVSPLYTNTTGAQLAALPYDPSLGPTSREALLQAQTTPESPNLFQKVYDKVSNYSPSDKTSDMLTRLGLAGALGLYGASNNRAAAASNRAATAETQAIAAPYQQQGQNLIQQAQSGTLSPASQAAYAAAQAQLAQAKTSRGGVGAQQTANQMATLYQTLLNNQYTYGLQVAQIGDNIAVGAIKQGLAMDQSLNTSTQNFYTNLASIVAGVPAYRQVAPTPTTPTGATP
jgi:hypothetical protein